MSLENIINDYLDGIGLKLQDPSDKALTYFHEKKQLKHKYSSMELTDSTESIQDDDVGSDNSLKERLTLKRASTLNMKESRILTNRFKNRLSN